MNLADYHLCNKMSVFLCRQKPYGDKLNQSKDVIDSYVGNQIKNRFIAIPYLHNLQVVRDLGLSSSLTPNEIIDRVKQTHPVSLDTDEKKRNQKKGRIIRFLSNVKDATLVIPHNKQWVLVKCGDNPVIKNAMDVCYQVTNDHNKRMVASDNFSSLAHTQNIEMAFCVSLPIHDFKVIDPPKDVRLPPVSLQQLTSERIAKIINDEFR